MGETYPYPVFFRCDDLNDEQKRKIKNHFTIVRKSDGGECGSVTRLEDGVYSISFKDRAAQQRVLQRSEHVLEVKGGSLVLTVQDSPPTPGQPVSPELYSATSSQEKQQSIPPSSLPPSGEEYELQLDSYLLRYVRESPEAGRELERKLASVGCSAPLYSEQERVLLRSLAQPGEVRNWKSEVDKVFDSYMCHYEVDCHKVRALLQSSSSRQTTGEVKVYSEVGMAVVVGERSQVNAMLKDLEGSHVIHQKSQLRERRTSVRRLGDAKLQLLWEEIKRSIEQSFPGVEVAQGDAGQLVLSGSAEEIYNAGRLISQKETLVLERMLSDKSPHFLAFLRKVYGGPGELRDFLGVGEEVEVQLRDTELGLFSLSADKLDDTEKKIEGKFKDVKFDIPNCSDVPSELREKLKSKSTEMNRGRCQIQVVFGSDSTLWLLGHTKEVEELSEIVTQFILDQAFIEGKVILPFPELVQLLPELLQLLNFDSSGVTLHPITSSSKPMMALEGPSSKVTEVRNRLGPLLQSLVRERITIDLPGTLSYLESHSGRDSMLNVSRSHKCLIQLEEQPHTSGQKVGVAKYSVQGGLQVLVYQGDITKQYADALVNAANENLDHAGGVAAALSKAGGPQVQRESKAIVKQFGKIATGNTVITTGGNLKCKNLLHAVGPIGGKVGGKERELLEKTVHSALDSAENLGFKSIAIPCISSGVFGVPVAVCSEAIVAAVKKFGCQGGRCLSRVILIDNREEVVRAMQDACDRLLQGTRNSTSSDVDVGSVPAEDTARGATAGAPGSSVHVEIVQGTIETQEVDSLVSPIVGHDPLSTRVGKALSNVVGPQLAARFHKEAERTTVPGEIVVVERLPALKSKAVIFVNLVAWGNNQQGTAVQALREGIRKILASCEIRCYCSVALPVLGTGALLQFPHSVASKLLLEEIDEFKQQRGSRPPFLIRIVIHPNDKESTKAFQSAQETLSPGGFTNDADPAEAPFYRRVSVTNDEVTATLGRVTLQMIRGDIITAGTDVIVNTTGFSTHSGVSKAILTAAGPSVIAELAKVGVPADFMCTTGPGLLGCREIIHANFRGEAQTIHKKCKKILKQCESKRHQSVAFPAINTGEAGMDPAKACKAMLDGMASAIRDLNPHSLSLIRIVIIQQPIFETFRSELENRFGQSAPRRLSLKEKALQKLKKCQEKLSRISTSSAPQSQTIIPSKPQPAVISVISCGSDIIKTIKGELEGIVQKQLVEREVEEHFFSRLDDMELNAVQAKVKLLGISMEHKKDRRSDAGARDRSGSGQEVFVLRGLKEDVLSVTELINRAIQKVLCEDLQSKDEALLALSVQWSIKGVNGVWQELSLRDNSLLEKAHSSKEVSVDVETPDGVTVKVNLKAREATDWRTGLMYKVKRSESQTALECPAHWELMHEDNFKKVTLQPNSQEYQNVAQGFLKTAKYTIQKIERVQNLYLWYAYSICRQRILAKNGLENLGEKMLYHGTSADSCKCIERGKFDRRFAGAHGSWYGKGVYFAVDANYSASRFSPKDTAGLKRLYAARVLTGRYTKGESNMQAPPPRDKDPTDRYDSLVDKEQLPTMFVIFHDDQAYPEYLITFS